MNGRSVFGGVQVVRALLAAALLALCVHSANSAHCEHYVTVLDIDYPNSDLLSFPAANAAQCAAGCAAYSACAIFAYRDNTCWLKTLAAFTPSNQSPHPGILLGFCQDNCYTYDTYANTDYPNSDLSSMPAETFAKCSYFCAANAQCAMFAQRDGTCWLKSINAFKLDNKQTPRPGVTNGVCKKTTPGHCSSYALAAGVNYPNSDLESTSQATVADCGTRCANNEKCAMFVFSAKVNTCWLKTINAYQTNNRQVAAGVTTGVCYDTAKI